MNPLQSLYCWFTKTRTPEEAAEAAAAKLHAQQAHQEAKLAQAKYRGR
jgi:hypothetical protein